MSLQERFGSGLELLRALVGAEAVNARLAQLNLIFDYTEKKWLEYLDQIPGRRVRYVLIAEAPPWSESNLPPYALDHLSKPRTLIKALRGAFCRDTTTNPSPQQVLRKLADSHWLLLDSIPFSFKYTSRMRSEDAYRELVRSCVTHYLLAKANDSGITWSPDTRIAFSLTLNARAVLAATPVLRLGGMDFPLTEQMIAVNAANYPCAEALRRLYCLH